MGVEQLDPYSIWEAPVDLDSETPEAKCRRWARIYRQRARAAVNEQERVRFDLKALWYEEQAEANVSAAGAEEDP
jgi:hypothetical protein